MTAITADVLVIGAGIAGAGAAAHIARFARTMILEMEAAPGYHTTGRSASFYSKQYGNDVIRQLTMAAEDFFYQPPEGFTETPLIRARDWIYIARPDQSDALAETRRSLRTGDPLSARDATRLAPILREDYLEGALFFSDAGDLDVSALHQAYLRQFRQAGGAVHCDNEVETVERVGGVWRVQTRNTTFEAPLLVNAAGAWADVLAERSGVRGLGLQPKRRTVALTPPPDGHDVTAWPLVVDVQEEFYFRPEGQDLLVTPADETPSPPCDAQPELEDVALGIDRFEKATTATVTRVKHKWAGLRTFAPDRTPIAGFDPRTDGFFWLAGQGGYGVQTAPTLSALAGQLIEGRVEERFAPFVPLVAPDRFL